MYAAAYYLLKLAGFRNYRVNIGMMDKKMEATIMGYIGLGFRVT